MKPAIGDLRVSTTQQGNSGLELDAQQAAIEKFAADEQLQIVELQEVSEDHRRRRKNPTPMVRSPFEPLGRLLDGSGNTWMVTE